MKKTLSILLMFVVALQSLIAFADAHHVLPSATVAAHEHESTHAELACHVESLYQGFTDDGTRVHQDHCCHASCSFAPFLTHQPQHSAGILYASSGFLHYVRPFSSWISTPDFRPPIV
ncbi:MAG TPA: hypothetical protein VM553_12995 [Dongiaceae bacterium]|nr:hypothetical protein [Dongiaceae bacterium]